MNEIEHRKRNYGNTLEQIQRAEQTFNDLKNNLTVRNFKQKDPMSSINFIYRFAWIISKDGKHMSKQLLDNEWWII